MKTTIAGGDVLFGGKGWAVSLIVALVAMLAPAVMAGDLDASQQKLLADAKSHLETAKTNLKLVQDSTNNGKKTLRGSALKLTLIRLDGAKQPLPQVAARLEKLPADNDEVKAVQAEYDAVQADINSLELALTGKSSEENAAANAGTKLDYQQEEKLKNARFYVREIQGKAQALEQLTVDVNQTQDKDSVDYRKLMGASNTINEAAERAKLVQGYLDELPADGAGVKATTDDFKNAMESVGKSREYLKPVYERVMGLVNPATYPELEADIDRLGGLSGMYSNTMIFETDRPQAASVLNEGPASVAERDRIVTKYARLIQQQTDEGKRVEGVGNHFVQKYQQFLAEAERFKGMLPGQIQSEIDEARDIAKEAVEQKKPLYFSGGLPQHMEWLDDKLALYKVLDPDDAKKYEAEVAKLRDELKKGEAALREQIINENKLPEDNYTNADRDAVIKYAVDGLKKTYPDAEVLTVRIPMKEWKHEVLWRFQNEWYKIDRSKIQPQVVIKHDGKLAIVHPVNVWKNHLSNDEITAFPLFGPDWELQPSNYMLLDKVK